MASKRRRLIWLCGVAISATVAAGWIGAWVARDRQLDCREYGDSRAGEICRALTANMEYEWFGHAIIAPGYRVTFETARLVYCELKIAPADLPVLGELLQAEDWRLQNGADFLIRLATGHDRHGTPEAEVSIFNPSHPEYILKEGCGG